MEEVVSRTFSVIFTLFVIVMAFFTLLSCGIVVNSQEPSEKALNESQCNVSFEIPLTDNGNVSPTGISGTNALSLIQLIENQRITPIFPYQNRHYIPVTFDSSITYSQQDSIIEAMRYWNQILGRRILRIEASRTRHDQGSFFIRSLNLDEYQCERNFYAVTQRYHSRRQPIHIVRSEIEINNSLPIPDLTRVMIHEFGHAFGLAHDADQTSVMYPQTLDVDWEIKTEDIAFVLKTIESIPYD
jgi:predicted Zn-dependent protease